MKKSAIIISGITGLFLLALCTAFLFESGEVSETENAAAEETAVSTEADEQSEPGKMDSEEELEEPERTDAEEQQEGPEEAVPREIEFAEPVVTRNGERGKLDFFWKNNCIRVDADTLLLVTDCYFAKERLQQKIFFVAKAPDFTLKEVFRQDAKIWEEEKSWPEHLERRWMRPYPVEGGYVYELDGVLYFLDETFQEIALLCDLDELMGELCPFSIDLYRTCDVSEDVERMIACTDEGLYEYDLQSGDRKLLESAYFAPHEIDEEDCLCGQRGFLFDGPVKAEYGPDEKSYAFLTGTEEADWGDITGIVLRSGTGETLYQKKSDDVYDFMWIESEDTSYFAVFYTERDEDGIRDTAWLMDRVDIDTGEVETFEAPEEIYSGGRMCCVAGFIDADTLLFPGDKPRIYHFSSGEQQDLEAVGEADWEIMVIDMDDFGTIPVRYPRTR